MANAHPPPPRIGPGDGKNRSVPRLLRQDCSGTRLIRVQRCYFDGAPGYSLSSCPEEGNNVGKRTASKGLMRLQGKSNRRDEALIRIWQCW